MATVVHYVLSSASKIKLQTAVLSSSHFRWRSVSPAITSSLQCLKITPHTPCTGLSVPPTTTSGAHAADPVTIETATDFSRAGVLGKGSHDMQYKWDRQDNGLHTQHYAHGAFLSFLHPPFLPSIPSFRPHAASLFQ